MAKRSGVMQMMTGGAESAVEQVRESEGRAAAIYESVAIKDRPRVVRQQELIKGARKKKSDLEKVVIRAIKKYCAARGIYYRRTNSGGARVGRNYIQLCPAGTHDAFVVHRGVFVAVEGKRVGEKQEDDQKLNEAEVIRAGGRYIVVEHLDEFIDELKRIDAEVTRRERLRLQLDNDLRAGIVSEWTSEAFGKLRESFDGGTR